MDSCLRHGLRGVRIGEGNDPGPRRLWRQRCASSSEDELLFRPMEGRDVIPRMESRSESGSNRFAALDDPETVPAGTQELEVVGFIRERSSFAGDCDFIPETILDALEEYLERPSRRLVLVVESRGHTAGEHLNSTPVRSDIYRHDHKRFKCGRTHIGVAHGLTGDRHGEFTRRAQIRLSDKAEEPMEDVPTGVRERQDLSGQTLRALMVFLMPKVRTFVSQWPQPNQ